MLPYKKYDFQIAKSRYSSSETCIEKWLKPLLDKDVHVTVMPIVKGKKVSVVKSKNTINVYLNDKEITKYISAIIDDLSVVDVDFVLEGFLTTDLNEDFELGSNESDEIVLKVYDMLHYGDLNLTLIPFDERFEIAKGFCEKLNKVELAESLQIEKESDIEIIKANDIDLILKSNQSLYDEGHKTNSWCEIVKEEATINKAKGESLYELATSGMTGSFITSGGALIMKFKSPLPIGTFEVVSVTEDDVRVNKVKNTIPTTNSTFKILKSSNNELEVEFNNHSKISGIYKISDNGFTKVEANEVNVIKALEYIIRKKKKGDHDIFVNKSKDEEQFILSEVLVPDDVDLHEDTYTEEDVRFAAHYYMENFGNVGKMHTSIINDQAVVVENYLSPVDFEVEASDGTTRQIKKGSWLMGLKIKDADLWQAIKDGVYTGLSIGGVATVEMIKSLRSNRKV